MATVTLTDVGHRYPSTVTPSIEGVNLHVKDGEFFVLLGPSGCGKSTLLRMIHGLERPTSGTIHIGGRDVTAVLPSERDVSIAFESYALYPHMDVAENMGFALRLAGIAPDRIAERVQSAAARLGLEDVLGAKPEELDGLQRQKVALARALVRDPQVLVMDEPLVNLPAEARVDVRDRIKSLQSGLGITTLYATTDVDDARAVADRIAVVADGRIERVYEAAEFPELTAV